MKNINEKKEMEYEDAPSGFVTLYNYKEPFMPYKDQHGEGYGYQGVLLFDGNSDKLQCHLCGEWCESLRKHLSREHSMRVAAYKHEVGLNQSTALIGEKLRAKFIEISKNRKFKLYKWRKKNKSQDQNISKKITIGNQIITREKENVRGTCPAQLIDRLIKLADKLGRRPKDKEVTFRDTLIKVYGSFANACEIAGLDRPKVGNPNTGMTKFDAKQLLEIVRIFKEKEGRDPSTSDCKRGLIPAYYGYKRHFGSLKNAIKLI